MSFLSVSLFSFWLRAQPASVINALQQMGGEPALEGLAVTATRDPAYSLRSKVIRFLGEAGDQNALPILQEARETARDIEDSRWRGRINRRVNEAIASIERGE